MARTIVNAFLFISGNVDLIYLSHLEKYQVIYKFQSMNLTHILSILSVTSKFFQINSVVSTNRSRNEWIDFGIHTEACMTDPVTCGTAGGAISLWLKQTFCSGAYFTTRNAEFTRGSSIRCIGPFFF